MAGRQAGGQAVGCRCTRMAVAGGGGRCMSLPVPMHQVVGSHLDAGEPATLDSSTPDGTSASRRTPGCALVSSSW
jgi:hypothetical protein